MKIFVVICSDVGLSWDWPFSDHFIVCRGAISRESLWPFFRGINRKSKLGTSLSSGFGLSLQNLGLHNPQILQHYNIKEHQPGINAFARMVLGSAHQTNRGHHENFETNDQQTKREVQFDPGDYLRYPAHQNVNQRHPEIGKLALLRHKIYQ